MQLYASTYGPDAGAPPLVILHGLLGSSGNWHTLSRTVFGKRFRVYALDQRNHGRSPHATPHTYPAMAQDVVNFLDRHGLGAAHVLGHSMGGKTAMEVALAHPARVRRLVVADMAPTAYPPQHQPILDALARLDPSAYDRRDAIDAALAEDVPDTVMRQFLLKNLDYDADTGTYAWQMNLPAIRDDYDAVIAATEGQGRTFDGPALFVRGGHSDYVADDDLPAIRARFPQARLATIDGAGHWLHAEAPEAFARTVMDFLAEDAPRT
jgi:pimeloyl-ACP methyl ester carboxylesterase